MRSRERMGRNVPSKTLCVGLRKVTLGHCDTHSHSTTEQKALPCFFLSPLIVGFFLVGGKIQHNGKVHGSLTSPREHLPVFIAHSSMTQEVPCVLWGWVQQFLWATRHLCVVQGWGGPCRQGTGPDSGLTLVPDPWLEHRTAAVPRGASGRACISTGPLVPSLRNGCRLFTRS